MALVGVMTIHAQDKAITANVPFSFYAGSTAMPVGAYRVAEFSNVARLSAGNATQSIVTMRVIGKSDSEPARLVFHRYGDVYFLAQIWTGDSSTGRSLERTDREKELARNGAAPTLAVIRFALPK